MDLKMTMSLKDLSKILAAAGILISTSQEEKILTAVESLSAPPDPQEASYDFLCQTMQEEKDFLEEEKPFEPEIKEFLSCLSSDLQRTQEIHYPIKEDLYGKAKKEDIWGCINEEMDQGHQDYIERWFQMRSTERHHSFLLQNLLLSYHLHLLIFHAHV
jgi:hypothetical protein